MTAAVATAISDFLRDAQARVGVLSGQITYLDDEGSQTHQDLTDQRKALYDFMEILNDNYVHFYDNTTTFIQATGLNAKYPAWTDREVLEEIEYLRAYGQLLLLPFFVFVGYYPQVIGPLPSSGYTPGTGWNPPPGNFLQIVRYDSGGNLVAVDFPDYWGMRDLNITDYFAGRS